MALENDRSFKILLDSKIGHDRYQNLFLNLPNCSGAARDTGKQMQDTDAQGQGFLGTISLSLTSPASTPSLHLVKSRG